MKTSHKIESYSIHGGFWNVARPKKNDQELRNSIIGVRFTTEERDFITSESDVCGLSVSSFIRHRTCGKRITPKTDLRVLAELRRLGGLLKHTHNETKGAYSSLTSDCLKEIAAYVRGMNRELDKRRGGRDSQ
jgi:hypothetical protein